jgi:hypothetical protein
MDELFSDFFQIIRTLIGFPRSRVSQHILNMSVWILNMSIYAIGAATARPEPPLLTRIGEIRNKLISLTNVAFRLVVAQEANLELMSPAMSAIIRLDDLLDNHGYQDNDEYTYDEEVMNVEKGWKTSQRLRTPIATSCRGINMIVKSHGGSRMDTVKYIINLGFS